MALAEIQRLLQDVRTVTLTGRLRVLVIAVLASRVRPARLRARLLTGSDLQAAHLLAPLRLHCALWL